jgi:hypothetical protein
MLVTIALTLAACTESGLSPGLHISRDDIELRYYDVGIIFKEEQPDGNASRSQGSNADGTVIIEIIGNPRDISEASATVFLPSNDPEVVRTNTSHLRSLLEITAPDWRERFDWLGSEIDQGHAARYRGEGYEQTMRVDEATSVIFRLVGAQDGIVVTLVVKAE